MTERIQLLRRLSVKLEVSGTATVINNTKLYQGGFGFVLLQAFVPVTQNAIGSPLLTVYRSVIDNTGQRVQYGSDVYTLVFAGYAEIDGSRYMVFETPMPRAFTTVVGELEMVFNYIETEQVDDGDGGSKTVIRYRMTTNIYSTTVEAGGVAETDIELGADSVLATQVNANTIAIGVLQEAVSDDVPLWVDEAVSAHNLSDTAHADIRGLINGLDLGDGMTFPAVQDMMAEAVSAHNLSDTAHADADSPVLTVAKLNKAISTDANNAIVLGADGALFAEDKTSVLQAIQDTIPASASLDNKLVDRLAMIHAIVTNTTRFLTYDTNGNPFPTYADLSSATEFYYEGGVVTPTNNDFCVVLSDENYDNATVQYLYDGSRWVYMYKVSEVAFTDAQWAAINSGATAANIAQISTKQDTLVSGVNLRTVNGNSLLGGGDVVIPTGAETTQIADAVQYTATIDTDGRPTSNIHLELAGVDIVDIDYMSFAVCIANSDFTTMYSMHTFSLDVKAMRQAAALFESHFIQSFSQASYEVPLYTVDVDSDVVIHTFNVSATVRTLDAAVQGAPHIYINITNAEPGTVVPIQVGPVYAR